MRCPAIITGDRFLGRVLEHIDCQAQLLGSFGYQALAQTDSPAFILLSSLLTIFIALFGVRLVLGYPVNGRDVVASALKVGIVLTLAFSWPAFKIVVYDTTVHGPAELVAAIGQSEMSAPSQNLAGRLEATDTAIVQLTAVGAGRNIGANLDRTSQAVRAAGSTQEDVSNLSNARLAYLAGTIGSLGLLRVLNGLRRSPFGARLFSSITAFSNVRIAPKFRHQAQQVSRQGADAGWGASMLENEVHGRCRLRFGLLAISSDRESADSNNCAVYRKTPAFQGMFAIPSP